MMKFDLDYDSGKGTIALFVDGQEAIRWKDSSPIEKGKYIILHTSNQTSFDDIVVSRTGDSLLPSSGSEGVENDVIMFVNGDVLSGKVVNVSDENIVVENEYDPEGVTVAKTKISSVRFKRSSAVEAPKADANYKFVFWNDDVISGRIISLDEAQFKNRIRSGRRANLATQTPEKHRVAKGHLFLKPCVLAINDSILLSSANFRKLLCHDT